MLQEDMGGTAKKSASLWMIGPTQHRLIFHGVLEDGVIHIQLAKVFSPFLCFFFVPRVLSSFAFFLNYLRLL